MPEPASKPLAGTSWIWSQQRSSKSPTVSDRGAYIIRTISDGAGDDSHLSYTEMVAMVAHNSALCVEDLLRIMP